MSNHKKSSSALSPKEDSFREEREEVRSARIIPWPDLSREREKEEKEKRVRLDQKFLYHRGKKIPILQFQKSGYDKLLKLLVKEIKG